MKSWSPTWRKEGGNGTVGSDRLQWEALLCGPAAPASSTRSRAPGLCPGSSCPTATAPWGKVSQAVCPRAHCDAGGQVIRLVLNTYCEAVTGQGGRRGDLISPPLTCGPHNLSRVLGDLRPKPCPGVSFCWGAGGERSLSQRKRWALPSGTAPFCVLSRISVLSVR